MRAAATAGVLERERVDKNEEKWVLYQPNMLCAKHYRKKNNSIYYVIGRIWVPLV